MIKKWRKATPIPDHYWKSRKLFRLTAHLYGRRRNCYRVAIVALQHVLEDCTIGRRHKKQDMKELRETRIEAGAQEHGIGGTLLMETLMRCKILLNRKSLADLAIWEPRTFKALTDVAKRKAVDDEISYTGKERQDLSHFITKGLLRNE